MINVTCDLCEKSLNNLGFVEIQTHFGSSYAVCQKCNNTVLSTITYKVELFGALIQTLILERKIKLEDLKVIVGRISTKDKFVFDMSSMDWVEEKDD